MPVEELNGTPLHYELTGEGPPLVLVHAAWSDSNTWAPVLPDLASSFQVVTYDLRGHGRSRLDPPDAGTVHDDVGDLVALIERLGVAPVNVAGISSAACIALRLAAWHPELVHRVFAHEPPFAALVQNHPQARPHVEGMGQTLVAVQALLESGDHVAGVDRFMDMAVGPGTWANAPDEVKEMWLRHAPAFLGQLRDPDALVVDSERLRPLAGSVLLCGGTESPPVYALVLERLAAELPGIHRYTITGAGHLPHLTHPGEFASVITQFARTGAAHPVGPSAAFLRGA